MGDLTEDVLAIVNGISAIPYARFEEVRAALREYFAERIVSFDSDTVTFSDTRTLKP